VSTTTDIVKQGRGVTFGPSGGVLAGGGTTNQKPRVPTLPKPSLGKLLFASINSGTDYFIVYADLNVGAPVLTGGYAKWNTIDRPERKGLTTFAGYDPVELTVPILFDNFRSGYNVEAAMTLLERMAGRGPGAAATKSVNTTPPVIEIQGDALTRIIANYKTAPNWVVTNIEWDASSFLYNHNENIVRAACVVTCEEYVDSPVLRKATGSPRNRSITYKKGTRMHDVAHIQRTTIAHLRTLNHYRHNKKLDPYLRDQYKHFKRAEKVIVPIVKR
jgi:hypothetical protein